MKKRIQTGVYAIFVCVFLLQGVLSVKIFARQNTTYLEWTEDPLRSIVVNWITENSTGNPQLQYRVKNSAQSWVTRSGQAHTIPHSSKYRNSVLIQNLSPGTSYEVRVGGTTSYFRTPPSSVQNNPIKFVVGGDIYNVGYEDVFVQTSIRAAEQDPYFAVLGGDLAYADADPAKLHRWFDLLEAWHEYMITPGGYMIPLVAGIGNHEVSGGFGKEPEDAIFFHAFFSFPQNQWPGETRTYGALDFGNYLSIIVLDTDHTHRISGSQTNWLQNTLDQRKNVTHVFPAYHVGAWPSARPFSDDLHKEIRSRWVPLFEEYGVRFAFEHHDHTYKRTHPLMNATATGGDVNERGVTYIGDGAWGIRLRDVENRWYLEKAVSQHHFNLVEISDTYRKFTAIGTNGETIDQFEEKSFLPPPQLLPATDLSREGFRINWKAVDGAKRYRLDISKNSNFSSFHPDYSNRNAGQQTHFEAINLEANQTYFFRVRAEIPRVGVGTVVSGNSEPGSARTAGVHPGLSTITASHEKAEANFLQSVSITVVARNDEGDELPGVTVSLFAKQGTLYIDDNHVSTDDLGRAVFNVTNNNVETVTYGAVAGGEELIGTVDVTFIPVAPIVLQATQVETRKFVSNWEMVTGADSYLIDVSEDSSFSEFVNGYHALDTGNITTRLVEDVGPGTRYLYRIRAVSSGVTGANSQSMEVYTFPDMPVAVSASNRSALQLTANWQSAEGAKAYLLTVAEDPDFEHLVSDFENKDVGNVQSSVITGLDQSTSYFYRVRSVAGPRVSDYSNVIETSTLMVSSDHSEIRPAQQKVLANGTQVNEVTIIVRSNEGLPLEGIEIALLPESGHSQIDPIQNITNAEGMAVFGITNTTAETVTYTILAATLPIGKISVEFLRDGGVPNLAQNFPNPFAEYSFLPLTVPRIMHINLTVYNSIGMPVRIIKNEQMEPGYYEIPFNGADLAAGLYFYRLITDDSIITKKMILLK